MKPTQPHLPDRTWEVEAQLRARALQLKPSAEAKQGAGQLGSPRKPLGCCRRCSAVVYTGDSLAMIGGYLVHGECA